MKRLKEGPNVTDAKLTHDKVKTLINDWEKELTNSGLFSGFITPEIEFFLVITFLLWSYYLCSILYLVILRKYEENFLFILYLISTLIMMFSFFKLQNKLNNINKKVYIKNFLKKIGISQNLVLILFIVVNEYISEIVTKEHIKMLIYKLFVGLLNSVLISPILASYILNLPLEFTPSLVSSLFAYIAITILIFDLDNIIIKFNKTYTSAVEFKDALKLLLAERIFL
jgi:membrane protein